MFKKIINILILGILASIFLPLTVNASTFENGDTKYELKLLTNTCSLNSDAKRDGLFKTINKLVFVDTNQDTTGVKEFYTLDENNVCTKMTTQQILDYYNQAEYEFYINDDYEVVKFKNYNLLYGYVSASGTTYSSKENYYENSMGAFFPTESVESELDNYYIMIMGLSYPTEAVIDENITYYTMDSSRKLTKVLEPKVEDIYLYYYKDTEENSSSDSPLKTYKKITSTDFIAKLDEQNIAIAVLGDEQKQFIMITKENEERNLYDVDGNLVNINLDDLAELHYINSLFFYTTYDMDTDVLTYKIYNSNGELLYTDNGLRFIGDYYTNEEKSLSIITAYKTYGNYLTYMLKEYKLLTEDNQIYNNDNMVFKFSGNYDDVESVKVNDVELNQNDYTLTNGSTIITLKKEYLDNLSNGNYTLKVTYNNNIELTSNYIINKVVPETIEKVDSKNPKTGDRVTNYLILGIVSLIGLLATTMYVKKIVR